MRDGQIVNVIIDLREEKNLRSDIVNVGGIKKPREQKVYPAYYQEFKRVIDACIPKMLSSGNAKTVNYGLLLREHAVSPHILYIFPFKPQKSKLSFSSMAI